MGNNRKKKKNMSEYWGQSTTFSNYSVASNLVTIQDKFFVCQCTLKQVSCVCVCVCGCVCVCMCTVIFYFPNAANLETFDDWYIYYIKVLQTSMRRQCNCFYALVGFVIVFISIKRKGVIIPRGSPYKVNNNTLYKV